MLIIYLSHLKVQKAEDERNPEKANKNHNNSLKNPLSLKKRNNMKGQTIIITMKITEAIIEAADPTGANDAAVESLTEVPNKEEGASKTIIADYTKATMGNTTPPMEAITIIIIMVIIEVEVDVAMVVIITEVTAMDKAVIMAIIITNVTNITHMMMAHRWSNTAHHVHFAVVSITPLSTVLRESMT